MPYGDAEMSSTSSSDAYLTAEARARVEIDGQLEAAGWVVQMARTQNPMLARA